MAVDDVLSLRVVGRYQQQNIVNTLHYRITEQAVSDLLICLRMIEQFEADIESDWLDRHSDAYELVGYKCFRATGGAKTPAFKSIGSNGTVVGTEIPSLLCRTITLYTVSDKHRRRGRIMLSGTDSAMLDIDDGSVTTVEITALTVLGVEMAEELIGAGEQFQLCIPATSVDPAEDIIDAKGRETPSAITTRRIRQFLIG